MSQLEGVILAAGLGKRMMSDTPKVLHEVCGRPILAHLTQTLKEAGISNPIIVCPPPPTDFSKTLGNEFRSVIQQLPQGTGNALLLTKETIGGSATHILCVSGDCPLLKADTIGLLLETNRKSNADITLLTALTSPQEGLGRVLRGKSHEIIGIVEERFANEAQITINEVNAGVYCIRTEHLWQRLENLETSPNGEVLLTGLIESTIAQGGKVDSLEARNSKEILGINTRVHLAAAETIMREDIRVYWMNQGVTISDPISTFIDASVILGSNTKIFPNTHLKGDTQVGKNCELGPNSIIVDTTIGDNCLITGSTVSGSQIGDRSNVGPFSNIRPHSQISSDVHIGTSVEIKQSQIGIGTKIGHFSYIGDSTLGKNINIGAGTVTCNFDGTSKHHTVIEDNVFIGSGTMIIPPITIGANSNTGAGSVVNRDVLSGQLVFGNPAKPRKPRDI
jgi:bifunctional UDP-N-acetylglucosamine pyrophosphorylase/glucosamine-1-phosphate N-acetyltransferase